MSVLGNAIGNSIVDASKPKAVDPMFDLGKAYSEKEKAGQKALFFGGSSTDLAPGNSNRSQSTWKPSPDEIQQVLASGDQALTKQAAEAAAFDEVISNGSSVQLAALSQQEFVAQAQALSDKLHVQPGFVKNHYDNAMSEASNPNNSWIKQTGNLLEATKTFLPMVAEELGRGLMNIPSAVAGAVPAADRLGNDIGAMLDTSLTTSDRFIAGGNALIDFSAGFTGLGAPATFFTGGFSTAPLTAEQRGLQGFQGGVVNTAERTGAYGSLVDELKGTGLQANHLNQNAAFKSIIPSDEGFAIGMRGNAFTEVGSPHYEFHSSLEGFWNQYRKGGEFFGSVPTNAQYGGAVTNALKSTGLSNTAAARLSTQAAQNRAAFGLLENQPVPRIPGRLPQAKP